MNRLLFSTLRSQHNNKRFCNITCTLFFCKLLHFSQTHKPADQRLAGLQSFNMHVYSTYQFQMGQPGKASWNALV